LRGLSTRNVRGNVGANCAKRNFWGIAHGENARKRMSWGNVEGDIRITMHDYKSMM